MTLCVALISPATVLNIFGGITSSEEGLSSKRICIFAHTSLENSFSALPMAPVKFSENIEKTNDPVSGPKIILDILQVIPIAPKVSTFSFIFDKRSLAFPG